MQKEDAGIEALMTRATSARLRAVVARGRALRVRSQELQRRAQNVRGESSALRLRAYIRLRWLDAMPIHWANPEAFLDETVPLADSRDAERLWWLRLAPLLVRRGDNVTRVMEAVLVNAIALYHEAAVRHPQGWPGWFADLLRSGSRMAWLN